MWSSSRKVFFLMALMAISAITIVQGITCYNCDSDDHKDCDEFNVSSDRVEVCNSNQYSFVGMEPMCKRIVSHTYPVNGEGPVFRAAYRGCMYVSRGAAEGCEDTHGSNWKSTRCWCKSSLCNR